MTRPSDFTLNTDYLTIAQVSSNTFTASFGSGSLSGFGDHVENSVDFNIASETGAIDNILIRKDGGSYSACSTMRLEPTWSGYEGIAGFVQVYRPNASTIRVRRVLENYSPNTNSYPSMTFNIKVSSFKPPNVF